MRLGIGGRIGPVRAGVSNRGFGGGLGPVSGGGSWSGGGGCAYLLGIILLAAVIVLPWQLGAWVATKLGADNPSTVRTVVAWTFEGLWLTLIVLLLVAGQIAKHADRGGQLRSRRTSNGPAATRDIDEDIDYGSRAERFFPKAWPRFSQRLRQGERVLGVFMAQRLSAPSTDFAVITNERFLATGLSTPTDRPLPLDVPIESVEAVAFNSGNTLIVKLVDGSEIKVGTTPKTDREFAARSLARAHDLWSSP